MTKKPTLGQILIMAGGGLTFIFGFLAWVSYHEFSKNAWGGDGTGLFPTYTLVGILALVVGVLVAVKVFAGNLPDKLWIFTLEQIEVVVGAGAFAMVLCFMVADKGQLSAGIGAILSIFTTAAVLAGAILEVQGIDPLNKPAGVGGPGGAQQWGQPQQPGWNQPQAPAQPPAPGWGQPPAGGQAPPPPPAGGQAPPPPPAGGQAPPPPPPGQTPPPPPGQGF